MFGIGALHQTTGISLCDFFICIIFKLFVLLVPRTGADAEPILTVTKIFAFITGSVRGAFCVSLVALASILHHRNERYSIIRVNRLFRKVGIDHNRFA